LPKQLKQDLQENTKRLGVSIGEYFTFDGDFARSGKYRVLPEGQA